MAGRDKFTIGQVTLKQAENGGWFAMAHDPEMGVRECLGAFTTKGDLLKWLGENLRFEDEPNEYKKQEGKQ